MSAHTMLRELAGAIDGELLLPEDAGWAEAARPWNLAVEQRPAAVVTPANIADVTRTLAVARAAGLGVTVQPGGHGAHGDLADCVLIRPSAFDEFSIDVAARTARVGAGVQWGTVLRALEGTGLIALAGSNPTINVVAFILGGGHSAFGRSFGLAAHALLAVEMVTANGEHVRVDATHPDSELLWALRGGGGQFGVVTAMEFAVHPAPGGLYGGQLTYPAAAAVPVLHALTAVAATAPDELSVSGVMMVLPDAPMVPEPLRGQTIVNINVVSLLARDTTEALLAPLRAAGPVVADTIAEFSIGALPAVFAEPLDPMPALEWSALLGTLDTSTVDALVGAFVAGAKLGLSLLQIRPLGGAIARAEQSGSRAGVAGVPAGVALAGASALVFHPDAVAPGLRSIELLRTASAPHVAHGRVVTFLAPGEDLGDAYDDAAVARLRAVKSRIDPEGRIRSNRPLPVQ